MAPLAAEASLWAAAQNVRGTLATEQARAIPETYGRDSMIRAGRAAGKILGTITHRARGVSSGTGSNAATEKVLNAVKDFIRKHPSSLAGASVAGFVAGRILRAR